MGPYDVVLLTPVLDDQDNQEQNQDTLQADLNACKKHLKQLEEREDSTYEDMKRGLLDELQYHRRIRRLRDEREEYQEQFERLSRSDSDAGLIALEKVFELATQLKSLWKDMSRLERVEILKKVCSNPTLSEATLQYEMKKPFQRLSSWKGFLEWRREAADLRTEAIAWAAELKQ